MSIGAGGGAGAGGSGAWLQCTHVAEGHVGAALCLAATHSLLYSGGVGKLGFINISLVFLPL